MTGQAVMPKHCITPMATCERAPVCFGPSSCSSAGRALLAPHCSLSTRGSILQLADQALLDDDTSLDHFAAIDPSWRAILYTSGDTKQN